MSTEIETDAGNVNTDIDISTANTMRERAGESRLKLWLLLKANRLQVTAVLAVAVFIVFVVCVTILPPPCDRNSGPATRSRR